MFINVNGLGKVQELSFAPAGTYPVSIVEAGEYVKAGQDVATSIKVVFHIGPQFYDVDMYLGLPKADDAERTAENKVRRIQRLCHAAGLQVADGFDPADLVGAFFDARVGVEPVTDRDGNETGRLRNYIVIPQARDE